MLGLVFQTGDTASPALAPLLLLPQDFMVEGRGGDDILPSPSDRSSLSSMVSMVSSRGLEIKIR